VFTIVNVSAAGFQFYTCVLYERGKETTKSFKIAQNTLFDRHLQVQ